ncbi:5520_t:CDS:2, partial [Dentiscutata erythropus]
GSLFALLIIALSNDPKSDYYKQGTTLILDIISFPVYCVITAHVAKKSPFLYFLADFYSY